MAKVHAPEVPVREWIPQMTEVKLQQSFLDVMGTLLNQPYPFLLDSAMVTPEHGRYSFMGSHPFLVATSKGDQVTIETAGTQRTRRGHPLRILQDVLAGHRIADHRLPLPFVGGAVGYFGYDLGRFIEVLPERAVRDLDFPDMAVALYHRILAYDHQEKKTYIVELSEKDGKKPKRITLATTAPASGGSSRQRQDADPEDQYSWRGNFTKEAYLAAIACAKEYIAAGDIYQVNLSQRFQTVSPVHPWKVFQTLRQISPAPYSAYLHFGSRAVISSSPEQFIEVRRRRIVTRPIKGTRRRGNSEEEDRILREELGNSPKDDAELAMIVDLERNDLGRICTAGSVRVSAPKLLEAHPTVFHLSATIEGTLQPDVSVSGILEAVLPGGSVTGAPKIRAMEIIEELEPTRRSVYTGAFGAIGFDGSMNLAMAIRTILADGSTYTAQAGGAIVADSDPEKEYEETLIKARAMKEAIEIARKENP